MKTEYRFLQEERDEEVARKRRRLGDLLDEYGLDALLVARNRNGCTYNSAGVWLA